MRKQLKLYFSIAIVIILAFGCNNKKKITTYFKSGKVKQIWFIDKDSIIDGLVQEFYESGVLRKEYYYEKGKLNGRSVDYYENSKVQTLCFLKNGLLDSVALDYDLDGNLKSKSEFCSGRVEGNTYQYDKKGRIWRYGYIFPTNDSVSFVETYDTTGKTIKWFGPCIDWAVIGKKNMFVNDSVTILIAIPKPINFTISSQISFEPEGTEDIWKPAIDSSHQTTKVKYGLDKVGTYKLKFKIKLSGASNEEMIDSSGHKIYVTKRE